MRVVRSKAWKRYSIVLSIFLGFIVMTTGGDMAGAIDGGPDLESLTMAKMPKINPADGGLDTSISLDLRSIDINDALKYIALKAGLNIVVSKSATGTVTLTVRNVMLRDALDIILRSNDLAYAKRGGIYQIMTNADYKALYGKSFADVRQVRTFRLKYAIPEQAFNFIDALKSDVGRVVVDQESGTVVVLDTEESLKEIEKAVVALETKGAVKVFDLQYAKARIVEEHLNEYLTQKNLGSARADERSNQVIVYTLPGKMSEIESIIQARDKKTKQVFITAQILKITLNDNFDTGVDWNLIFGQLNEEFKRYFNTSGSIQLLSQLPVDPLLTAPGAALNTVTFGRLDAEDHKLTLQMLKTIGETKILSNPRISVMNNQEARIHVGERQVYVTTTTTTGQTTQTTAEEATFIDVGIQLSVTPTINDDGFITMKIKPEISSVVGDYVTPTGNVIPIIDTSTAETSVVVKDGATIIIGGLRRDDKTTAREGIPYLMDIPIIGEVFKARNEDLRKTELLILITPTIVEGDQLTTGDKRLDEPDTRGFYQDRDYTSFKLEDIPFEPSRSDEEKAVVADDPFASYRQYGGKEPDIPPLKGYKHGADLDMDDTRPISGFREYKKINANGVD